MSSPTTTPTAVDIDQEQNQTQDQAQPPTSWSELRKQYPQLPEHPPQPTRSVECNIMSYINDAGVQRQIWMPKGTMMMACQHFEKKDWKALEKWPTHIGQGYKDEGEEEEKERKEWEWLVVGEKGKDGKDGKDGQDGKDGKEK